MDNFSWSVKSSFVPLSILSSNFSNTFPNISGSTATSFSRGLSSRTVKLNLSKTLIISSKILLSISISVLSHLYPIIGENNPPLRNGTLNPNSSI